VIVTRHATKLTAAAKTGSFLGRIAAAHAGHANGGNGSARE
jgi:hypothetical protein